MHKINASENVIKRFVGDNNELDFVLNYVRQVAQETLKRLRAECDSKLAAYNDMAAEVDELCGQAGAMRSQAEKLRTKLKAAQKEIRHLSDELYNLNDIFTTIDRIRDMIQRANYDLNAALNVIADYKGLRI